MLINLLETIPLRWQLIRNPFDAQIDQAGASGDSICGPIIELVI